jgi:hypothetical protein
MTPGPSRPPRPAGDGPRDEFRGTPGTVDGLFRDTLAGDDHDEAFLEAMTAPRASEVGVMSVVRTATATNSSHTTEVDPADVTADTLRLWGTDDEFQPVRWAEWLEGDILDCELVGLEADHWVPDDRRKRRSASTLWRSSHIHRLPAPALY